MFSQYVLMDATPDYETITGVLSTTLSTTNITAVLSYALGAAVGLVFLWWAARKCAGILKKAFMRGKLRF